MRLAAQAKLGFYAAPPEAVAEAMKYLRGPAFGTAFALDPCAGKGEALAQLSRGLGLRPYTIELDEKRAEDCHRNLTIDGLEGRVLAPASFFGCTATFQSFSFIWLNPPFDDEVGGGMRTEHTFLQRATQWLRPGGILCFVIPEHVSQRWDVTEFLGQWYTRLATLPFPAEHRKFEEVIVFGIKRSKSVETHNEKSIAERERLPLPPNAELPYDIPPGHQPPKRFEKIELTQGEIAAEFAASPLKKWMEPPADPPLPQPPLPLATGHLALLLAAGHLDGVVRPAGEPPHVVRGTAHKVTYTASVEETENKDGSVTTRTIQSEKILLTVRTAEQDGTISTLSQE
jgi:16S rRNA G966 N2-methylase RsmD